MYLTDFGACPLPDAHDRSVALGLIDMGILDMMRSFDLDVLAELVAVSAMVDGDGLSPAAAAAGQVLSATFDKIGVMPSRNFCPLEAARLEHSVAARCYLVFNTYHTTHVFAMMRATLIGAGLALPRALSDPNADLERRSRGLEERNVNAVSWLDIFHRLDLPEQDLAAILYGIEIFDGLRHRNAEALFNTLNTVKSEGHRLPGRLYSDTLEHLARLSLCRS